MWLIVATKLTGGPLLSFTLNYRKARKSIISLGEILGKCGTEDGNQEFRIQGGEQKIAAQFWHFPLFTGPLWLLLSWLWWGTQRFLWRSSQRSGIDFCKCVPQFLLYFAECKIFLPPQRWSLFLRLSPRSSLCTKGSKAHQQGEHKHVVIINGRLVWCTMC